MTLLFSIVQAIACAEAGSQLISPFVGRILDWYKQKTGDDFEERMTLDCQVGYRNLQLLQKVWLQDGSDGGKLSNTGEIKELVGCDLLGHQPQSSPRNERRSFRPQPEAFGGQGRNPIFPKLRSTKASRFQMNEDEMATTKLAEGIRKFSADVCP